MEAKANYSIVGFVVVILALSLVAAMVWLSSGFEKKEYNIYAVYMHEAVSGLNGDSLVKYNGVGVGRVKKIALDKSNPQRVKLLLSIESGIPVTTSTFATLISQGITGTTYIGLSAKTPSLTPLKALPGQPYPVIPTKPSMFTQLDIALKEITVQINAVGKDLRIILNKDNREYIRQILKNMAQTSKKLPELVREIRIMSKNLAKASTAASQTLGAGKLAINKISQQTLPPFNQLLQRLDATTANLEQITVLMRQNPAVIIRGTTPPMKGPGE